MSVLLYQPVHIALRGCGNYKVVVGEGGLDDPIPEFPASP